MPTRIVQGMLVSQGVDAFAFLHTHQPFDLTACATLRQRTLACSGQSIGTLSLHLIESECFPDRQGFAVLTDRPRINPHVLGVAVRQIFRGTQVVLIPKDAANIPPGLLLLMCEFLRRR